MTERPWLVFAGGGTGGHLFPALSVVESLRARNPSIDVAFFCTTRPIDTQILGDVGIEAMPLTVQPFSSKPWHWLGFWSAWRSSVLGCRTHYERRRPVAVIGAGGYASGPPVAAALQLGIPTFLLNPDAVPGRANKHLARRRGLGGIFAQWPQTLDYLPARAPVMVTGCPVRRAFREVVAAELDPAGERAAGFLRIFGLESGRRTLLVTGASQGARTVNEALLLLAPALARTGWQILHLSGPADLERVREGYARAQLPCAVLPFTDRMAEAIAVSDLIVSRAGASTLAEILVAGKPSILLPYPFHRDMHQRHNGQVLVDAGAAVMLNDLRDAEGNARQLGPVLHSLIQDDAKRAAMAKAARNLARPDAADLIAAVLHQLAGLPTGTKWRLDAIAGVGRGGFAGACRKAG